MQRWNQQKPIWPSTFPQVSFYYVISQRMNDFSDPILCVSVCSCLRSLHPLVCTYKLYVAFVTDSIGARPKNATLLLRDALAYYYHFTGRRQWRRGIAISTRAPALRSPRVPRTPCGCPAPYHAARHQLVPCSVKSVLGFRAVQLACRFTLLCSCLASRLCAVAFFSYSYLRNVITYTTVQNPVFHPLCNSSIYGISLLRWSVGYRIRILYGRHLAEFVFFGSIVTQPHVPQLSY